MKSFARHVEEALSPQTQAIKDRANQREAMAAEVRKNPLTLCDVLSEKTPATFIDMVRRNPDDAIMTHIKRILGRRAPKHDEMARLFASLYPVHAKLYKTFEGLREWFEQIGGSKRETSMGIMSILACKDRASWASWQGRGYRGLQRSLARVSMYSYTGKIENFYVFGQPMEFLVATTKYRSKYPLQSWTDDWGTAWDFASGMYASAPDIGEYAVILEANLTRNETILNPDVIAEISRFSNAEREVIRFRNTPETVKVYVRTDVIVKKVDAMRPKKKETEKEFMERIVDSCLVPVVGEKVAKKVMEGKSKLAKSIHARVRDHGKWLQTVRGKP